MPAGAPVPGHPVVVMGGAAPDEEEGLALPQASDGVRAEEISKLPEPLTDVRRDDRVPGARPSSDHVLSFGQSHGCWSAFLSQQYDHRLPRF